MKENEKKKKIHIVVSSKVDRHHIPSSQLPVDLNFRPSLLQSRIFVVSHCNRMARRHAVPLLQLRWYLMAIPV